MGLKRIKISELTLSDNLKGLYTIGVKLINGVQTSVKVSLEHIQTAYENAVAATKKAETAANSANTAAGSANSAASSANNAATKANTAAGNADKATAAANTATTNANNAAALANEKAVAADTAAGRVNAAITQANTAATNAQQQASAAGEAAAEATESVAEMNAALARLEELEQTITAKDRKQPTGMELEFPKKITKGNKDILRVIATLSPAGTGNNVLFLGDDKAVSVAPDGFLTVNSVGISKIHVIPTENTSIYRTIDIEVVPQSVRLCTKSTLRLTANGKFRFN